MLVGEGEKKFFQFAMSIRSVAGFVFDAFVCGRPERSALLLTILPQSDSERAHAAVLKRLRSPLGPAHQRGGVCNLK